MQFFALDKFAGLVNQTFDVALGEAGTTSFVLVEARPLPPGQTLPSQVRAPFSLLFRHEAAIVFPQKTYPMQHEALGEFGIFLVPIARDRTGFIYQALFN
ncbi:hypothetical protein KQ945_09655 [Bacillus subtilis subsp. subtilis]|nr:hypothetical protein [Bacillus subtilis subsp. subtilis]